MRNITKLTIVLSLLVFLRLVYEFPDTALTINIVDCDNIQPIKIIAKSKGYFPRHLSQCGWSIKEFCIHVFLLIIPFLHNLIDPQYILTRFLRRIVIFIGSLLLMGYSCYSFLYLIQYPTTIVDNMFHLSRSAFITTVIFELCVSISWFISVFTSMNNSK
ncbi:Uncharacterized protein QTN25_010544 [Entamoeba marina]